MDEIIVSLMDFVREWMSATVVPSVASVDSVNSGARDSEGGEVVVCGGARCGSGCGCLGTGLVGIDMAMGIAGSTVAAFVGMG